MVTLPSYSQMTNAYWQSMFPYPKTCSEIDVQLPLMKEYLARIRHVKQYFDNSEVISQTPKQLGQSELYLRDGISSRESLQLLLGCGTTSELKPKDTIFQTDPPSQVTPTTKATPAKTTEIAGTSAASSLTAKASSSFEKYKIYYFTGIAVITISAAGYFIFKK